MTQAKWARVEELFQAALERERPERESFLREACGGDEELRRELLSLLAEERSAERLMERPPPGCGYNPSVGLNLRHGSSSSPPTPAPRLVPPSRPTAGSLVSRSGAPPPAIWT